MEAQRGDLFPKRYSTTRLGPKASVISPTCLLTVYHLTGLSGGV